MKLFTKRCLFILAIFVSPIFLNAQMPLFDSFSPESGAIGTLITIKGTNFNNATNVAVGDKAAIIVSRKDTQVIIMVMPGTPTGLISMNYTTGVTTGKTTFYKTFNVTSTGYPSIEKSRMGSTNLGFGVSISADMKTAITGDDTDNSNKGAAWVYNRTGDSWVQQGNKLVGSNAFVASAQGYAVAISADGNTAVVGGRNDGPSIGAVWIYVRTGNTWTQQGEKLVGTGSVGEFVYQGKSVAISADGNTVIVGAPSDNVSGAVWVFVRDDNTWKQLGDKITTIKGSFLGWSVAISADGNTFIAGGYLDNGDQGAAWVYNKIGNKWIEQAKLVGKGNIGGAQQGFSVAISADGNTAVVGGNRDNNNVGAVWIFVRDGNTWTQQGNKLFSNDYYYTSRQGASVAISADGNTVVIGGDYDNNIQGAAWAYTRLDNKWTERATLRNYSSHRLGFSISLSADGSTAVIGALQQHTSFAALVFAPSSTLPLQLIDFNAAIKNNQSNLNWQTAQEVNVSHFNIQRSTDGVIFSSIGKMTAKGDGSYSYSDDLSSIIPQPSTLYYRLQMVDKDGSIAYSKIVIVTLTTNYAQLSIFPNPVKEILTAQITSAKAEKATLQITDMQGKVLQQKEVVLKAGSNNLPVNTAALTKGTYVLVVKGKVVNEQRQFVKE